MQCFGLSPRQNRVSKLRNYTTLASDTSGWTKISNQIENTYLNFVNLEMVSH
jgi:hypothetical protein